MAHQRFRVPGGDGEVLSIPDFSILPRLIEENRRRLRRVDVLIDGQPLHQFRARAREEILQRLGVPDETGPLLLTGHQPELFHPGVWVKIFSLYGLSKAVGGVPLNLSVDNDTLKSASLRFPVFEPGDPSSAHAVWLPFDRFTGETPYEGRRVLDEQLFRSFPSRAEPLWRNWGYEPLLARYWRVHETIAGSFRDTRWKCEEDWDCRVFDLSVSELATTKAFGRFAAQLLRDLPRFREVYNAAIRNYRRLNRIRSRSHPAPELGPNEAPFWTAAQSERGRQRATTEDSSQLLRPRALTLTLFARLCLGDFFIHGIGGGKYDEVTDQIIQNYFGVEPPGFQVLTATLRLPLPGVSAPAGGVERLQVQARDVYWNPQRHLSAEQMSDPAIGELLAVKDHLIQAEPPLSDHAARRRWFHALQDITAELREFASQPLRRAEAGEHRARIERAASEVLHRRDYSWVLYPEATLRPFLERFLRV
jgi:hypothetical protein